MPRAADTLGLEVSWHAPLRPAPHADKRYSTAMDALRSSVTLLVVAHHAVLAYHEFAPAPTGSLSGASRWWLAFPVVDEQRWSGFTFLVAFNDMFLMALLFLVSGLFVHGSLCRKGSRLFLRDRAVRLGAPFVLAAALVAPLAYYPAYLQTTDTPSVRDFADEWRALGSWPAGPAWFLWVLLAFNAVAAALFARRPEAFVALGSWLRRLGDRPVVAAVAFSTASAAVYVPMAIVFGPLEWATVGPFTVQTSRALNYALYFAGGVALGATGAAAGVLAPHGRLARGWLAWSLAAVLACAVATWIARAASAHGTDASHLWTAIAALTFAPACAAACFGALAVSLRFLGRPRPAWGSLRRHAYGIYLVHYAAVTWLQYALLPAGVPGIVKGLLVFVLATVLSWAVTAVLRRAAPVARVI